jgi:preprotein translocase subunit SecE
MEIYSFKLNFVAFFSLFISLLSLSSQRLAAERKQWRKDRPFVRNTNASSLPLILSFFTGFFRESHEEGRRVVKPDEVECRDPWQGGGVGSKKRDLDFLQN